MGASNGSGVRTSVDDRPAPAASWLDVVATVIRSISVVLVVQHRACASGWSGCTISSGSGSELRSLAFYLPRFHPIPDNEAWRGRGSTVHDFDADRVDPTPFVEVDLLFVNAWNEWVR
jgi:hypothetical protein